MSAERKALLEISEDDVNAMAIVAAHVKPSVRYDPYAVGTVLHAGVWAVRFANRMHAALSAAEETK